MRDELSGKTIHLQGLDGRRLSFDAEQIVGWRVSFGMSGIKMRFRDVTYSWEAEALISKYEACGLDVSVRPIKGVKLEHKKPTKPVPISNYDLVRFLILDDGAFKFDKVLSEGLTFDQASYLRDLRNEAAIEHDRPYRYKIWQEGREV
jgi:hypothetical protein